MEAPGLRAEAAAIEWGDPAADAAAYRRSLGQFATGVTVVTARAGGALAGVTANSFSSVSLAPPLILWSIRHGGTSYPVFEAATHFAVNVLAADQIALSQHFGRSGPDKFSGLAWSPGVGGAPLLPGALARFECRVAARHPGGDHTVMVGEVERFSRFAGEALLFAGGRYGLAADHPDMGTPSGAEAGAPAAGPMNDFLAALLYRAHGMLSAALERGREVEGFTLLQSRILAAIDTFAHPTPDLLRDRLFLGSNATQNTLDELTAMGLLEGATGPLRLTTLGREKLDILLRRTRRIETDMLAGIPPQDLATLRRVLTGLIERSSDA